MRAAASFLVLTLLISLAACSEEKTAAKAEPYADLKAVYTKIIDAQDQLAVGVEAATDAKKIATVIRTYTAKMRELSPELNAAQSRYPELSQAVDPPAVIASTVTALGDSNARMMDKMVKIQSYLEDQDVVAAMNDLANSARTASQP